MAKFLANFDIVGLTVGLAAILILLYFGVLRPSVLLETWAAYAFWAIGFFGSLGLGLVKRTKTLTLTRGVEILMFTGIILAVFLSINIAYTGLQGDILSITSNKVFQFAIGVSEELFFGVFLLGILINWLNLQPALAVLASAAVHTVYHIPNWGAEPHLLLLFFVSFAVARAVYVFLYPYVGVIVSAHGFWNLGA
jgi:hypothetical protein